MFIRRNAFDSYEYIEGVAELLITVGGCDENCDEATAVESYNPQSGVWRSMNPFAGNLRGGYAAVGLGNDIYVTGELCCSRRKPFRYYIHKTKLCLNLLRSY